MIPVAGRPLLAYSIEHARISKMVNKKVVSTEDPDIAAIAEMYGSEVVWRPPELATDTASSESVLLHALDCVEQQGFAPDLVVFLQCTSPVREPDDIDNAIGTLLNQGADSLFSATPSHWLIWRRRPEGLCSFNYDYRDRRRDQELPKEFRENGSIYVFKPWVLREHNNRLGGKISVYEMDYWSSFQIDSPEDLQLCEWIIRQRRRCQQRAKLPEHVEMVVFDFDGVFTDNRVLVSQDGKESVYCSRADSLGISQLKAVGLPILVLSTETHPVVKARCNKLGIDCYYGLPDKLQRLKEIIIEKGLDPSRVIYLGNDSNDVECLRFVGCGAVVSDASLQAVDAASIVLTNAGGCGAVRELCDLILDTVAAES